VSGIFDGVLAAAAHEGAWTAFIFLALIASVLVAGGLSEAAEACARALRALDAQGGLAVAPESRSRADADAAPPPSAANVRPAELLQP